MRGGSVVVMVVVVVLAAAYIKALFLTCPACFSLALRECVEKKGIFVVILLWPGLA